VTIGLDGSDAARAALDYFAALPLPTDLAVRLVGVVEPLRYPSVDIVSPQLVELMKEYEDERRSQLESVLGGGCAELRGRVRKVTTTTLVGQAAPSILSEAATQPSDLVVVGARGLGAVKSFLLGGVSLGVVREAPCSVLVVKGEPHGLQRAVIALDGSAGAVAALRLFTTLPLNRPPSLALIGVVEPIRLPATSPAMIRGVLRAELDRMHAEYREQLARRLDEAAAGLGPQFVAERRVVAGHPAEEIVKAAETSEAGVVVVGARGLGALRRAVLGSVSEHVVLHASCPVLVVKPSR
jgi:nucleotide-binding universal stress UspA family protein